MRNSWFTSMWLSIPTEYSKKYPAIDNISFNYPNSKRKNYLIKSAKYRLRYNPVSKSLAYANYEGMKDLIDTECNVPRGFGWEVVDCDTTKHSLPYSDDEIQYLIKRNQYYAEYERIEVIYNRIKNWRKTFVKQLKS